MTPRITAPRTEVEPRSPYALPPVPATLPSVLGPVPVTRVTDLRASNGKACFGIWTSDDRKVRIESDLVPVAAWQTYWHEWVHIVLWDAGIKLRKRDVERTCDAIATARVREMLDGGR